MSGETIVVATPPAAPETQETATPAVSEALQVADAIMDKAQEIAAETRHSEVTADRSGEIIALISEARDDIRAVREMVAEILGMSRQILELQVVDVLAEEMAEPAPAPEESAPAAVVEIATEGGTIEKETVVDTAPAPAEVRTEKKSRRWL